MQDERRLGSLEELGEWAQDEGLLDDSLVLGVDASSMTLALCLPEDDVDDPRERFRTTMRRCFPFTLRAEQGSIAVEGALSPYAPFGYAAIEGEAFGLQLTTSGATIRAAARGWVVSYGEECDVPIVRALDPEKLTFHGTRALTAGELRSAVEARGIEVQIFGNWKGSGQMLGSAFVRDVLAPPPLADAEALGGGWRLVRAGDAPTSEKGLWVAGQSLTSATYASVERTPSSDDALVEAVVESLAALLAWASSGNMLVEDAAGREAWRLGLAR